MPGRLLHIQGLGVRLGQRRLLEGIDLEIAAGETLAIVGASGSGKTTLLRAILGLLAAEMTTSGAIHWTPEGAPPGAGAGTDLLQIPARQWRGLRGRQIAWIPQEPRAALDPRQSAYGHLAECWRAHRRGARVRVEAEAEGWLQAVGLERERARQYPHQWSGGMQQRLLIAMALCQGPRLVLADEPTSALDALRQAQLLKLLRRLQREHDLALCLVTHDLAVAAAMAERVVVMDGGRMVEQGATGTVFGEPRSAVTARLVRAQAGVSG